MPLNYTLYLWINLIRMFSTNNYITVKKKKQYNESLYKKLYELK